jgi:hypothetical protein
MIGMLVVLAAMGAGDGLGAATVGMYDPSRDPRPIATRPPADMNGRLFISRPLIGPLPGPALLHAPGAAYYGAIDAADAAVPVRVGHLVVTISPWERIDKPGLRRFEEAREFWLKESNYTGGVRTFVNDRHLWEPPQAGGGHVDAGEPEQVRGIPQPRATIRIPEGMPRQRRPLRVEGDAPMRISRPGTVPLEVVERPAVPVHTVANRD